MGVVKLTVRLPESLHKALQRKAQSEKRSLRVCDAVQLATALRLNQVLRENRIPPLVFVSADGVLCDAARAEGVSAENPSDHP